MRIISRFIVFLVVGVIVQGLFGQSVPPMYFNHLTRENGLPSNTIMKVIQDFQGYVWIATTNGLVRYDGHDMKIFRSVPGDKNSLVDNNIFTLLLSSDSMIWIGTGNGLSIYDPSTRTLRNFPYNDKNHHHFPSARINYIFEEKKGSVWLATETGIVHATGAGNHFTHFVISACNDPKKPEFYFNAVMSILPDPDNPQAFLLGAGRELILFDTVKKAVLARYPGPPGIDMYIRCMITDTNRRLWAAGWGVSVGCLDLDTRNWKLFSPGRQVVTTLSLVPKSGDEFWVATDELGLAVFNKKTHAWFFYKNDPGNPRSISSLNVQGCDYFNDHRDFWTWGYAGIDIENKDYFSFQQVKVPYKFSWICDLYKDPVSDRLYAGTFDCNGMPVLDTRNNKWCLIPFDQPYPENGLCITQFYHDSQNRLWISTKSNLCYFDPDRNLLRTFTTPDGKPLQLTGEPVVYGITEDTQGNLWVGTRLDGVIRIDRSRTKTDYFRHIPGNPGSLLEGTRFYTSGTDKYERIWFGSREGLSIFDPLKRSFFNSFTDTLKKYGIHKTWINGIERDTLGRMWLAIDGAGLVRVETRSDGSFGIKLFHSGNGLTDPGIGWIEPDPDRCFWIWNNGLLYFNPYLEQFNFIDIYNGLHENPNGAQKFFIDDSGNIFFGDSAGFETRNIRDIRKTGAIPMNLVFEAIEINGKSNSKGPSPGRSMTLDLTADQNNLTFHYTAICFHPAGQIHYRYKLGGYDHEWVVAESSREARYTNLPPGKYTFVVSASLGQGWHESRETITVVIHPFFWRTWWFILLCLAVITMIIYGIYRYRINQLLKVERLRNRIATDLHDDVSSTLSSISIMSAIISDENEPQKSAGMIREIGTSAHDMLERIDDIIWSVNPSNDKFQDLGLRIREFAIPLFESKNILFSFEIPERLATIKLQMETRRNLYLIAKEAVNNLVKYSCCSNARILFREEDNLLLMEIHDDGKGFDTSANTNRNGLKNMQKRSSQVGGEIEIRSIPGKGTTILLKVKII